MKKSLKYGALEEIKYEMTQSEIETACMVYLRCHFKEDDFKGHIDYVWSEPEDGEITIEVIRTFIKMKDEDSV